MGWQGFQIMQGLVARVKNYILFKVRDCLLYSSSSSVTGRNPQNALAWRVFVTLRHWPLYWTVPLCAGSAWTLALVCQLTGQLVLSPLGLGHMGEGWG